MARQNVFILGATGNVGSELVRQILVHDSPASRNLGGANHENPTVIVGMASTKGYWLNPGGFVLTPSQDLNLDTSENDPAKFDQWKTRLREIVQSSDDWKLWANGQNSNQSVSPDYGRVLKHLADEGLAGDLVFVDVTADKDQMIDLHHRIITTTEYGIVTANKHPVASSTSNIFRELTATRGRYGLRCTVMAGAQAVSHLMELYDSNEHVTRIEGCFSGSLSYICAELAKGEKKFSDIVKSAANLNYTEPDPRDDLSGMDVARKLVILARCLGFDLELDQVKVEGLVDCDKYKDLSVEEFLEALPVREDDRMQRDFAGRPVKYVAALESHNEPNRAPKTAKVSPYVASENSKLAPFAGSANVIIIESRTFAPGKEYIIQAPGAGTNVTANGIRRDLLGMLRRRKGGSYAT